MFRVAMSIGILISLSLNGVLWSQNHSFKSKILSLEILIDSMSAQSDMDWHVNRATDFYELVLGRPPVLSQNFSGSPLVWEWAVTIPKEKQSEFQDWMHKKAPPSFRLLRKTRGGGGSGMRQREGGPEGVMELYSRHEYE